MNLDANSVGLIRASAMIIAVIVVMSVAAEVIKSLALVSLLVSILTPLVEWFENRGCLEHSAWFSTPDISGQLSVVMMMRPMDNDHGFLDKRDVSFFRRVEWIG
jgi:predicted PurR-regulated permease PerM